MRNKIGLLAGIALPIGLAGLTPPAHAQSDPFPFMNRGAANAAPSAVLGQNLRRLASNPNDVSALIGAGRAALALSDSQAALGFFVRADEISPRNGPVKAGLGSALVRLERPLEAMQRFQEAEQYGAQRTDFAADRGFAFDLLGDPARAQGDYRFALERQNSPEIVKRLAVSLAITGDQAGALTVLDPLLAAQDRTAWRTRAFIIALTGDLREAVEAAAIILTRNELEILTPYLGRLAGLNAAGKAQAVHFGNFPTYGSGPTYALADFPEIASAGTPGEGLVPRGETLGSSDQGLRSRETAREQRRRQRREEAEARRSRRALASRRRPSSRDRIQVAAVDTAAVAPAPAPPPPPPPPAVVVPLPPPPSPPPPPPPPPTPVPVPPTQGPVQQPLPESPTPAFGEVVNDEQADPADLLSGGEPEPLPPSPEAPAQVAASAPLPMTGPPSSLPGSSAASVGAQPAPGFSNIETADKSASPEADNARTVRDLGVSSNSFSLADLRRDLEARAEEERSRPEPTVPDEIAASDPAPSAVRTDPAPIPPAAVLAAATPPPSPPPPPPPQPPPPAAPVQPAREWVQIATGPTQDGLRFTYRQLARANAVFADKEGWYAPFGQTNRLLVGPFDSAAEAQTFLTALRATGSDAFRWRSPAGEEIIRLYEAGQAPQPTATALSAEAEPATAPADTNPARHWAQIGIGRQQDALRFTYRQYARRAPDAFEGKRGWSTSWGQTNRLLVGPFDTRAAAQAFLDAAKREGEIDGMLFRSDAGQAIEQLPGR